MKLRTIGDVLSKDRWRLSKGVTQKTSISGITDDSRLVKRGDLFFVISGKKLQGTLFIEEALQRGAACVVVEDTDIFHQIDRGILVDSTRETLAHSACAWHSNPSHSMNLVGITGTNGKTTTAYLLHSIWTSIGQDAGIIGTVDYRFKDEVREAINTTPGSLALQDLLAQMRDAKTTNVAMEVTSIALEQLRTLGTQFKTAVFTNLTQDHLDYHKDYETYFQAKRSLFCNHDVENAVINQDDPWGKKLLDEIPRATRRYSVSLERHADVFARNPQFSFQGTCADISVFGKQYLLQIPLIGSYNLINSLGVLAAAFIQGVSIDAILSALSRDPAVPGRLERVASRQDRPLVLVDFAHTPDALENVLKTLKGLRNISMPNAKIFTVFGCGGDRDRLKRPVMGRIACEASDYTIVTSDNPRTENPDRIIDEIERGVDPSQTHYHRTTDRVSAIQMALRLAQPGDIVLIAGKGHETYQIVSDQKLPFDDRAVIRDYYKQSNAT